MRLSTGDKKIQPQITGVQNDALGKSKGHGLSLDHFL
jgi:hypothetical protein